jgi:hypothetical protein
MDFRRSLSIQEYDSWLELGESLQGCNPQSDEADAVIWALEPKNHFPTKSLYRFFFMEYAGGLRIIILR